MKRLVFLLIATVILSSVAVFGQQKDPSVLDGIYVKEHVPSRKPVPYHFLREADMAWTKRIWRMIDMREKINHPLYYPTDEGRLRLNDRYSLIGLLVKSIENGELEVFNPSEDDEFTTPLTITGIDENFDAMDETTFVDDVETGEIVEKVVAGRRNYAEVTRLMLKEDWYFDKQRAKLEVRIIGLCPVRLSAPKLALGEVRDDDEEVELTMRRVMWVYFPAVRPIFANHEVFNPYNDAERRTFDDIFFKRRFSSYIFNETNVFNNRIIGEYKRGLDALLESERIKDFIFKLEHDLWEF